LMPTRRVLYTSEIGLRAGGAMQLVWRRPPPEGAARTPAVANIAVLLFERRQPPTRFERGRSLWMQEASLYRPVEPFWRLSFPRPQHVIGPQDMSSCRNANLDHIRTDFTKVCLHAFTLVVVEIGSRHCSK